MEPATTTVDLATLVSPTTVDLTITDVRLRLSTESITTENIASAACPTTSLTAS